jgi:ribosomal subunit interface protein
MMLPVQVTFRDIDHSDSIEAYVRDRASKLETFSGRIVGCHVVVEPPHRHHHTGRHYRVLIDLTVPGSEVVVSHAPGDDDTNEDVYAAVDEAFDRLGRRLEDQVRRQRGDVKPHGDVKGREEESGYREGRVAKLWSYEGYGFIETPDGEEVYFHRNSLLHHAFDHLAIGARVRFVEEIGEKGPQASTVALLK